MRRALAAVTAAALLAAGCGGGDGGNRGGSDAAGWIGMLGLVPDTPDNRVGVFMEDVAAVRQLVGVDTPSDDAGDDAVYEYLLAVTDGPVVDDTTTPATRSPRVFIGFVAMRPSGGLRDAVDLAAWREEIGVTITDLDADLIAGRPPEHLQVWIGSIEPGAVADTVATDPIWGPDLNAWPDAGVDAWCWGENPFDIDVERRTPVRPLGRGGCLAAFEGTAYRTYTRDAMEDALGTRAGTTGSLAEDEDLRLAAQTLEDAGTYTAFVGGDASVFRAIDAGEDPSGTGSMLAEYSVLGTGAGLDDTGEYLVLVLVHADEAAAAANAVVLEEIAAGGLSALRGAPWSEIGTVRSVTTEGRVVTAVFDGWLMARLWYQLPSAPDTLVLWG